MGPPISPSPPYGEHWRQARKLVTAHLFTIKKVHSYRSARKEEVRLVLAKVQEAAAAGTAVDMSTMMNTFANDIVSCAMSGKFFRAEGRNKLFRELVEANSALFGGFNLEDYFPGLARSLDFLSRGFLCKRAHEMHKRWDELLETILSDHERGDSSMHRHEHDGGGDFTDVLLSVQKEYGMTRDHVKAILIVSD
jgi:cytochrome P450